MPVPQPETGRSPRRATQSPRPAPRPREEEISDRLGRNGVVVLGGAVQQVADFVVAGLGEVLVPEADRVEGLRRTGADGLVGLLTELGARLGGADGHGDDDAGGGLV